jgi:hypothetical protein
MNTAHTVTKQFGTGHFKLQKPNVKMLTYQIHLRQLTICNIVLKYYNFHFLGKAKILRMN